MSHIKDELITISSESELFEVLESYVVTGKIVNNIDITKLPPLRIRLIGDKFDQSLTPNVMKGFVDMQNYINRTYRLVKYGDVNTKALSNEEKEALQLQIKIEKGSSLVDVNFDGLWVQIGQVIGKMTGTEAIVLILGCAAIWGSVAGVKRFLDNRKEVRLSEIKKESDRENLKTLEVMSLEETKRTEILAKLIMKNPVLENVDRQAYDARTSLFKSLSSTEKVEIDGLVIDTDTSNELMKNARRRSTEIRLDGIYKLEQVNSSDPNLFKVKVRNIKTGAQFEAIVQDQFLTGNQNKSLLMHAEWNRKAVKLSINAKILDEKIKDATILNVEEVNIDNAQE